MQPGREIPHISMYLCGGASGVHCRVGGGGVYDIYQNHTETLAVFLNMYQTQARCLESEIIIFFSRFRISNRLQNVRSWRPWLKFY